jgi:hypothetical protein
MPVINNPVVFTPLDTNNYITFNVDPTVNKSNPTITTLPTVSPINIYGPNLNSLTLNGGVASVPGTFVWTSPNIVPNFGTTSQSVTFIPTDSNLFNQITFNINIVVQNRATPSIVSNPIPSNITYLQSLSNSNLQEGSASVQGVFVWQNPSFLPNAGTNTYNVLFNPTNSNYTSVTIPISITVNKANPIINFPNIPKLNKSLRTEYTLNVTSNHNESPIVYSSSNTNVATVNGIKLNLISFGFSNITASQAESANYNSSTVTRQLEIIFSRLPRIISISNLPNGLFYNSNSKTLEGVIEDEGNYHIKIYLEEDGVMCEKTLNLMVSNKNKRYLYSINNPINIGFIKYNAQERIGQEDTIESYDHPIYGKILRHSKLGTIYGYIKDIKEEIEVYNHPIYGPILRNTRNGTIYGYTGDSNNTPNYINNLYGI